MQLLGSMAEARAMYQIQDKQIPQPVLGAVATRHAVLAEQYPKKHITPVHVHVKTCDVLNKIPGLNPAAPWKNTRSLTEPSIYAWGKRL